jgi:hypothetical protein
VSLQVSKIDDCGHSITFPRVWSYLAAIFVAAAMAPGGYALAQTPSAGTNTLRLCVLLEGSGLGTVNVVNPSQACPLGTTSYLIQVTPASDPPQITQTAHINADGTIQTQSNITDASGQTSNWIASATRTDRGNYAIDFADNAFSTIPVCALKPTTDETSAGCAPDTRGVHDTESQVGDVYQTTCYLGIGAPSNSSPHPYDSAVDITCTGRSGGP